MFFCRFKQDFGIHCTQMGHKTQCNPCFLLWWKALLSSLTLVTLFLITMGDTNANNRKGDHTSLHSSVAVWNGWVQPNAKPITVNHRHAPHSSRKHLRVRHRSIHFQTPQPGTLVTVPTAAGISITVDRKLAPQFQGFVDDLVKIGYTPKHIGCWASGGHVANSNHYHGGACDFDQTGWNRTSHAMYHIGDLASKWGLRDGCSFHRPDCGHVDDGTNIGWKHPNNLIAKYIDFQTSPVKTNRVIENFEGGL